MVVAHVVVDPALEEAQEMEAPPLEEEVGQTRLTTQVVEDVEAEAIEEAVEEVVLPEPANLTARTAHSNLARPWMSPDRLSDRNRQTQIRPLLQVAANKTKRP